MYRPRARRNSWRGEESDDGNERRKEKNAARGRKGEIRSFTVSC